MKPVARGIHVVYPPGKHMCGGDLEAYALVLTAAAAEHGVAGAEYNKLRVRL